jgi:hypothetical protein
MNNIEFIAVPGERALAELDRIRTQYLTTGIYPILIGDAEDKERMFDAADESNPSESLQFSQTINPTDWFAKRRELDPEAYQADEGDWLNQVSKMGIITHLDIRTRKPKKEVFIAQLKLEAPWEAFAHLGWGNWNECPAAAEHCAIQRYWASQYLSEVVSITGDVVQCAVSRPPTDRDTALKLAREQYVYCADIVDQGVESVAALAASLLNAKFWYFWWD